MQPCRSDRSDPDDAVFPESASDVDDRLCARQEKERVLLRARRVLAPFAKNKRVLEGFVGGDGEISSSPATCRQTHSRASQHEDDRNVSGERKRARKRREFGDFSGGAERILSVRASAVRRVRGFGKGVLPPDGQAPSVLSRVCGKKEPEDSGGRAHRLRSHRAGETRAEADRGRRP